MVTLLFCGGWNPGFLSVDFMASLPTFIEYTIYLLTFIIKTVFWFCMIALVKAFVPRYRYDQLMRLGWKIFLPASLVAVVFVAAWRVFAVGG
jgi:NADH-quinone oxidoreductase subunit H